MPWARAAPISCLTVDTVARQRGRAPQLPFIMSSTSSAVVAGSTVTGLSSGAGGSLALAQSRVMSFAVGFDMAGILVGSSVLEMAQVRRRLISPARLELAVETDEVGLALDE